jgi:hypothetical protein
MTALTSNQQPREIEKTHEIFSALRRLLEKPEPKSTEWQESSGRLVSLIAIETMKADTPDDVYLVGVILISRSQIIGVKSAKQRTISLTRFRDQPPPKIESIADTCEKNIAVTLLTKSTGSWCDGYAIHYIQNNTLDDKTLQALILWISKNNKSPAGFLRSITEALRPRQVSEKQTNLVIKYCQKILIEWIPIDPASCADQISAASLEFNTLIDQLKFEKKLSAAVIALYENYIKESKNISPGILLKPVFITALNEYKKITIRYSSSTRWAAFLGPLTRTVASLIVTSLQFGGLTSADDLRPHLSLLIQTYPKLDKYLQLEARSNQLVVELLQANSTPIDRNILFDLEIEFAQLLPAWKLYVAKLNKEDNVDALDRMLLNSARKLGVEFFGEINQVLIYDPVDHKITEKQPDSLYVTIIRPGLRVQRKDGTAKILLQALVK